MLHEQEQAWRIRVPDRLWLLLLLLLLLPPHRSFALLLLLLLLTIPSYLMIFVINVVCEKETVSFFVFREIFVPVNFFMGFRKRD